MYDEAADVALHAKQIAEMDWMLSFGSISVDWPNVTLCDVGGGAGLRAALLSGRVRRAYCADVIDQQARFEGEFLKLLAQKVARHGYTLPLDRFEIHVTDATNLIYRSGLFDFVCSVNAFEHIPDPKSALREIARTLKTGGIAYVSFDPIWTADTGSHFSHRVPEPWAHLVLSAGEFAERMRQAGAGEWELEDFAGAMNRVRLSSFNTLFTETALDFGLKVRSRHSWSGASSEANLRHPNFIEARRSYSEEELLIRGLSFVLEKQEGRAA